MTHSGEISVSEYADKHFCPCCGYLLNFQSNTHHGVITCMNVKCQSRFTLKDMNPSVFVDREEFEYTSKYQELQHVQKDNSVEFALVNEECPKCKNPQMKFYTLQTRSADEGQTVFYECLKCSYKTKVDT